MAETNYGLLNLQEETGETRNNQIKSQSYIDTFVLSWDDVPFPQDVVAHYKKSLVLDQKIDRVQINEIVLTFNLEK